MIRNKKKTFSWIAFSALVLWTMTWCLTGIWWLFPVIIAGAGLALCIIIVLILNYYMLIKN